MIRKHFWTGALALSFALACPQFTPMLHAQSQNQAPQTQPNDQKPQTLLGKVIKTRSGRYALLTDEQNGKGVYLDDQEKAKPFEGKNVKVTGTLDVATNTIHITDIELA